MYNIVRINKNTDIVENLEVADQEWIDSQQDNPDYYFLKYEINETIPYRPYIEYKYEREEQWYRYPPILWIGNYSDELLEIFKTEPELQRKLETFPEGSKELALVVREIEQRFR
jgi:hypothetical protein